jgi:thymidine phosphorylase
MDVLSVCETKRRASRFKKSLLLSASIIDMVHGTKTKVDYNLQRKSFHQETYEKFLAICKRKVVLEPEYAIYKEDVIAEKSGVVQRLTTEDWRNCKTRWRSTMIAKQELLLKRLEHTSAKGDLLYSIYSETKAS